MSTISVHVVPQPGYWPRRGGVCEHLIQLFNYIGLHPGTDYALGVMHADVLHVQSSYYTPSRPADVYTCHGGFLPTPIPHVLKNLEQAKIIVSVAQWIVDEFFPQHQHKTVVIPNGINLDDWRDIPPSGIEPGYILYGKEWVYHMDDFIRLAELMPRQRFVSTVWPEGVSQLDNVEVIGLQSKTVIKSVINDAACMMLPGPEVCPTMLLEAWACKTPVLAKNIAGANELMCVDKHHIVGGALYDDIEYEGPVKAGWFMSRGRDYGHVGYEEVMAKYQWADLFEEYAEIYYRIVEDEVEDYLKLNNVGR